MHPLALLESIETVTSEILLRARQEDPVEARVAEEASRIATEAERLVLREAAGEDEQQLAAPLALHQARLLHLLDSLEQPSPRHWGAPA